jgi:hypothetical protein
METTKISKHNPNDQGLIEVLPMPISLKARGREDDWTPTRWPEENYRID